MMIKSFIIFIVGLLIEIKLFFWNGNPEGKQIPEGIAILMVIIGFFTIFSFIIFVSSGLAPTEDTKYYNKYKNNNKRKYE